MPRRDVAGPSRPAPVTMVEARDPVDALHRQARHRQKIRPGYVLLHQQDGWSLVALGTSQEKPERDGVCIRAHQRMGRAMRLRVDTWFYAENMQWFRDEELAPRSGAAPCPRPVFEQLRGLWHRALERQPHRARPPGG